MAKNHNVDLESLRLSIIGHSDDLFHINVDLGDHEEAHKERMERDADIRAFHKEYGRLPEKNRYGLWE
jgi:hypothetical protein